MNLLRSKSIKFWTTILIIIVSFTTILLFGILLYINLNKSLEKKFESESNAVLEQTILSFEYEYSSVENVLQQLSDKLANVSSEKEIQEAIQLYQGVSPSNGSIIYGLENGDYYLADIKKMPEDYNPTKATVVQL